MTDTASPLDRLRHQLVVGIPATSEDGPVVGPWVSR
jgi:hypothetical protein